MCSIARRPALGFDAAAFLDRRRGVVAAAAPAARRVMAREPVRGVGATQKKHSRDDFDGKVVARKGFAAGERPVVVPAPGQQQRLQERMRAELDAIRGLQRKAVLLCRGAGGRGGAADEGARVSAAGPRSGAPMEVAAAKRVKTSPSKLAPAAAQKSTEPVMKKQQEKRPVEPATPPPMTTKQSVDKAREVLKRRRLEEMAQTREKCRQELIEVERTALPDETIYVEDLQELGIAFQYAVTRTRTQAVRSRLNGGE